jgi:hypothetical protein
MVLIVVTSFYMKVRFGVVKERGRPSGPFTTQPYRSGSRGAETTCGSYSMQFLSEAKHENGLGFVNRRKPQSRLLNGALA